MESECLKLLSKDLAKYRFVLVYGAGGVAENLLLLLTPYIDRNRTFVVVSIKQKNKNQLLGYSVRQIDEFTDVKEKTLLILAVMPRIALEIKEYIQDLGFRHYMTAEEISERLYQEIWRSEICKNKIVFSSWAGGSFGGNGKYIALDLLERSRKLDLVWLIKRKNVELPDGIRGVQYGTYEHYQELGTAHVWIDNQHKTLLTQKRKGQRYIQTWHGSGPLKKVEFDAENLPRSYLDLCIMNSNMEDIMISPCGFNSDQYRRAFHYTGEILECGYPRNDIFWQDNRCRQQIEHMFCMKPEEMMILYAPTFRNSQVEEKTILNLEKICQAMEKKFGRKCRMFVRFHPSDTEAVKSYPWMDKCTDVTFYSDVQELLAASDVLITDYSSIMWDFSLSEKPVFLFHPDVDLYEKERGYYLPFERMPYVEALDNEDLCRKIELFNEEKYIRELRMFLEEYGSFDRGTAAKAVGNRIMSILEG